MRKDNSCNEFNCFLDYKRIWHNKNNSVSERKVNRLRVMFKFIRPYAGLIFIALSLMFVELAVDLYAPVLMKNIIDNGILKHQSSYIIKYLLIMIAVSVIAFMAGIINSFFAAHICQMFSYDLRNAVFKKIQSFSATTLSRFETSSIITRLTSDVIANEMVLFMSLRIMLKAPLMVIGSMIMSFIVAPSVAWYLVIGVPFLFVFLWITVRSGMKLFLQIQQQTDRLNRNVQQNLEGVRIIKSLLSGRYETHKFNQIITPLKTDSIKALRLMESIMPMLLIVMNLSLLAVIWFGSKSIAAHTIEVGALVAIINYAMRMQGGFSMFAFIIMAYSRAKASADRISEVLLTDEDEVVDDIILANNANTYPIEFRDVSFKYESSNQWILKHLNFTIQDGEKFVIMGQTGSGKSALLSLLPRMYEATEGNIFIGDRNIKDWNLHELRDFIGYVPQKTTMFTGTIADNIRFGEPEASLEEVRYAAQIAQIHDTINRFDHQYEMKVGQQGVNLSGGQKQRLAIARAIIKKPHILILDDSTSALDIHTENQLFNALQNLPMTRVIVTQKVQTAKTADHILLLSHGQIESYGTHHELMKRSALYRSIVESQERGEIHD